MKYELEFTKKELDMLLLLRKKEWMFDDLVERFQVSRGVMDQMLSDTSKLHFMKNSRHKVEPIRLNQLGETVAQAEYDRRFDMYFTRAMSLLAIAISAVALFVSHG